MADLNTPSDDKTRRHYFVDEAGDGTIYNSKGKIIIGEEGVSQSFILGLLDIAQPDELNHALETLRQNLLADPYFKKLPSMQPQNQKTAFFFHAKDDLPEIRREVFQLLRQYPDLRFFAVVRDKQRVRVEFTNQNTRYHPNLLYDRMVSRLFKDRLHKEDEYQIYFASRGKSDRTKALRDAVLAVQKARHRFQKQHNIVSEAVLHVQTISSTQQPCLQAADYFLWALQRFYEKREDRYLEYLWSQIHLVHDVDDVRGKAYGVYYTQNNPLVLGKLPPKT